MVLLLDLSGDFNNIPSLRYMVKQFNADCLHNRNHALLSIKQ